MNHEAELPLPAYVPRTISWLGLRSIAGHALKMYGITTTGDAPDGSIVAAAIEPVRDYLAVPPRTEPLAGVDWWALPSHQMGSCIVHAGSDAVFLMLDVWTDAAMLRHKVWGAPLTSPTEFVPLTSTDLAMCVWELAVIQHERAAWLRHMYRADGLSDPDGYLNDFLQGEL